MRNEKPKIDLNSSKNLLVEQRETIREVFKQAVRQAILEHKRAGNPITVSENGQVIWIQPEDIRFDNASNK